MEHENLPNFEPMKHKHHYVKQWTFLFLALTILSGCKTISDLKDTHSPKAKVKGVRIDKADFQSAQLLFDVELENPNPINLNLQGVSYGLSINKHPFFHGNLDKSTRLKASTSTTITTPIELKFADLLASIQSLKGQDSFKYTFEGGFDLALPGVGISTIPVTYQGEFPILRPPGVKSISVKQDSLNLTGADLTLSIAVHNPNNFAFNLRGLDYRFQVNQSTWAKGKVNESVSMKANGEGIVEVPISLNFLQLGMSIYRLLTSGQQADYKLEGNMDLESTLPFLTSRDLPFTKVGSFSLQ